MITFTNIRNINFDDYDEVWAIVRVFKSKSTKIKHVPELSPSWLLLNKFHQLQKEGNWNYETFNTIYIPWFLKDLSNSLEGKAKLSELIELNNCGKSIACICFCADPNLCHRSIISKILTKKGISNILR